MGWVTLPLQISATFFSCTSNQSLFSQRDMHVSTLITYQFSLQSPPDRYPLCYIPNETKNFNFFAEKITQPFDRFVNLILRIGDHVRIALSQELHTVNFHMQITKHGCKIKYPVSYMQSNSGNCFHGKNDSVCRLGALNKSLKSYETVRFG